MTPSTSPFDLGRRGGPGLAVIDTPPAPPGWEDARANVVRIVDPLGRAVAWLAPAFGGRCVGFAVRPPGERGTEWVHVFHSADPAALRAAPRETGCGVRCTLAVEGACGATVSEDDWRFIERDPTTATLATTLGGDAMGDPAGRYGGVQVHFCAALHDGALALDLCAENRAATALRLHLGMHLAFVESLWRDVDDATPTNFPGRPSHQDVANTRIDIPPGAIVRLGGSDTPISAALTLITGVSQLCYLAPGAQGFASLLASADASPTGMMTLEAGATFCLAVALRVVLD